MRRSALRVATLEECVRYCGSLPEGLKRPMLGGDGGYRSLVVDDGAAHYWRMNGGGSSPATAEADVIGSTNLTYSTVQNGSANPPWPFLGGLVNDPDYGMVLSDLKQQGAQTPADYESYGFYPGPPSNLQSGPWSVEFWFFSFSISAGYATRQYLVVQDNGGTAPTENITWGFLLEANNQKLTFFTQPSAGVYANAQTPAGYADQTYHHVVGTLSADSKTITIYVDGLSVASYASASSIAPLSGAGRWLLLGTSGGATRWLWGGLDEVALYPTVALSATQVAKHYLVGKGGNMWRQHLVNRSAISTARQ